MHRSSWASSAFLRAGLGVLLGLAALTLNACAREEYVEDKVLARQYLNEARYVDAEGILRQVLERSPDDGEALTLLASSLAAQSGFRLVATAFTMSQSALTPRAGQKGPQRPATPPPVVGNAAGQNAANPKVDAQMALRFERGLQDLASQALQIAMLMQALDYIEKSPKREKILAAITTLDGVRPEDPFFSTAAGYSFLLNSVQFLNILRDFFGDFQSIEQGQVRMKTAREVICGARFAEIADELVVGVAYMANAAKNLNQMNASRPEVATAISKMLESTNRFQLVVNESSLDLKVIGELVDGLARSNCR